MSDPHKKRTALPAKMSSWFLFLNVRERRINPPAKTKREGATIQKRGGRTMKIPYATKVDRAVIIPEKNIGFSSSVAYTQNHNPKRKKRLK
jgi:hypothetical protein